MSSFYWTGRCFTGTRSQTWGFLDSRFWGDLHLAIDHQAQRAGEDYPHQHHQPASAQPTSVWFTDMPRVSPAPALHPRSCCNLRSSNCCTLTRWERIKWDSRKQRLDRVRSQQQQKQRIRFVCSLKEANTSVTETWETEKWANWFSYPASRLDHQHLLVLSLDTWRIKDRHIRYILLTYKTEKKRQKGHLNTQKIMDLNT